MIKKILALITFITCISVSGMAEDNDSISKSKKSDNNDSWSIPRNSVSEKEPVLCFYHDGLLQLKFNKSYDIVRVCFVENGMTTIDNVPHIMSNETLSYNININGGTIVVYSKNSIIYVSESM